MPKTEQMPVANNGAPALERAPALRELPPALIGLEVNVVATFAEDMAVEDGLRRPGPPFQVFASLPFTREAFVGLFDALLAQARADQAERAAAATEPEPDPT